MAQNITNNNKIVPFFGPVFEGLCQYLLIGMTEGKDHNVDDRLSFVASRKTKSVHTPKYWSKPARLLHTITKYAGPISEVSGSIAISGHLAQAVKQQMLVDIHLSDMLYHC